MGKKILSVFLTFCIVVGILPITAFASQAQSVNGFIAPIEDPDASAIRISEAGDLAAIKDNMYGSYVLMNDIDMSEYGDWTPIGTSLGSPFRGTFDGQGHTISGLRIHSEITSGTLVPPSHAVGLFGICNDAQIKNVALKNVQITVSNSSGYIYEATKIDGAKVYAGSIVGYATNSTVIYNCHSSGSISARLSDEAQGSPFAGGIAGFLDTAIISYSYNECTVNASYSSSLFGFDSYAGGLVGCLNTDGVIDHSYNSGEVTSTLGDYATAYAGGLVGTSSTLNLRITDCFNDATITSSSGSGGIFGGGNSYAGGIVASFGGSIQRSYNGGSVFANVNDSYGISNGNAYAGGICGEITTSATIEYSVAAHSTTSARAGGQGSSYQYRIAYGNGTKERNVTVSQVTSGSQNDANIIKSAEELKRTGVYRDELGWDFDVTWEMVNGRDFPQLKQVDIKSEEYTDEYITDHLEFINGNTYENIVTNYRWAQIYWSEENNFKSNTGEFLYRSIDGLIDIATLDFKELFDDDNPYKIILLDYISDQTIQDEVIELYKVTVPYSLDQNLKKAEDFVKKNWRSDWAKLDDSDLFWLFRHSDKPAEGWVTENFENHIDEIIFGLKDDTNSWAKVFNIADETWNSVVTAKQKYYDKTIDWINEFIDYSASVDAYTSANGEFKAILERMCENFPEETSGDRANKEKLKKAIEEYTQYNGKEDIRISLFLDYAQETVGNKIEDYLIKKFKSAVEDWIKNTFSATALSTLETIGWAADVTWKICEYVTSNGALMDCRQMLRSNAYFEATMYNTLRDIEFDFVNNSTIENARLFDGAFKFFKETQIYSMDTVISYFDTYQTAWLPAIQHLSNTFMNSAIEQVQINKMTLYKTYCHGVSYSLGGKVITIACPTDVYLYDENYIPVVVIEDSTVTLCAPEICAYTTDNVKIIVVPLDEDYTIEIFGTDDGNMDYSISEYDATLDNIQMTLYSDLALSTDSKYYGNVNNILGTQPFNYNLTNDSGQVEANYQLVTPDNNIPSTAVAIEGSKTSLDVGDTLQLSATITPQNATVQSLIWTSSNAEVATISEEGKLTALSEGSTKITVQSVYGGISDTIAITVVADTAPPEETYHLIVTNGTGSGSYEAGTQVSIAADAAPAGKTFDKWTTNNGGSFADASSASTTFTMPASDATVTATYKDIATLPGQTYALTVTNGTGSGDYEAGTQISIVANVAPADKEFDQWTANNGGTFADASSTSTTFTMPASDVTVTATYKDIATPPVQTYSLTVTNGTGSGSYEAGTQVSVVANAAPEGKQFDKWTTNSGGNFADASDANTIFTMPAGDVTVTATYKNIVTPPVQTYSLTVTNGMGSGDYETGTQVSIVANAAPAGKEFDQWTTNNGGTFADASSTSTTFTMPAGDVTVTATYKNIVTPPVQTYSLTVTNGTGSGDYEAGTQVSIVANAAPEGKQFDKWTTNSGGNFADVSSASTIFTMPAGDVTVTATYKNIVTPPVQTYSLTVTNGTGSGDYEAGTQVSIVANAAPEGKQFDKWTTNSGGNFADVSSASTIFTMPAGDVTIAATYKDITTPPTPEHIHNWTASWTSNETHHWHECISEDCPINSNSNKDGYSVHTSDGGKVTVAATAYQDGVQTYSCTICKYVIKTETIPAIGGNDPYYPSGGGSTGSGGRNPINNSSYSVNTPFLTPNGTIRVNPSRARRGDTVTITVAPNVGYKLEELIAADSKGNELELADKGEGQYTFAMPADTVKVDASFVPIETPWSNPFADVAEGTWYYDAVQYVSKNALMGGYGNGLFGVNDNLTRAQFAQILYNKESHPMVNYPTAFSDVVGEAWYAEAVRWAVSQGIVGGYGNGLFGPNDPITREQLAVMLWRHSGSPAATNKELHFSDANEASGYALDALCWAIEQGIINGKSSGILDPKGFATRAQVAQMLKNYLERER